MRRVSVPWLAALASGMVVVVLLPALLAVFGATAGVAVHPSLSLTEAASAFSSLALKASVEKRVPVTTCQVAVPPARDPAAALPAAPSAPEASAAARPPADATRCPLRL